MTKPDDSGLGPLVLRPGQLRVHDRGGGARTIPLVTRAAGASSFINGITVFDPGASVPFHRHNCDESVMIIEGRAVAEIDGVEYELSTFDTTFLPANVPHRFRNASATESMRMLWIYGSVDATRTLVATGETRPIDAEHRR
jgi:putative monooxygenase